MNENFSSGSLPSLKIRILSERRRGNTTLPQPKSYVFKPVFQLSLLPRDLIFDNYSIIIRYTCPLHFD